MSMERLQTVLGHAAEPITRNTAKRLGIQLHGQLEKCEACTLELLLRVE